MDLLTALKIIRDASDESLLAYATETISTITAVSNRLQHSLLPSPLGVHTPPPLDYNLSVDDHSDSDALNPPVFSPRRVRFSAGIVGLHQHKNVDSAHLLDENLTKEPFHRFEVDLPVEGQATNATALDDIGISANLFEGILAQPPFERSETNSAFTYETTTVSPTYLGDIGFPANFFDSILTQQPLASGSASEQVPNETVMSSSQQTPSHTSTQMDVAESQQDITPGTSPSSGTEPSDQGAADRILSLKKGVKKTSSWLLAAKVLGDDSIISRKRCAEDFRMEDIRRVEGDKRIDCESKLRRVLALRSIAFQYDEEQIKRGVPTTRLADLHATASVTSNSNKNLGRVVQKDFDLRALNNGQKHLVFERLLADCWREHGLSGDYEAISFVMALNIGKFHSLRYGDMLAAVASLREMEIPLSSKKDAPTKPLPLLLHDLAGWFHHLQFLYSARIPGQSESLSRRKKRQRLNPDVPGSDDSRDNDQCDATPEYIPNAAQSMTG